jgi:hypothetical protein
MKPFNIKLLIFGLLMLAALLPVRGVAQQQDAAQTTSLESRVSNLEHRIPYHTEDGAGLFLFGAFCALWAQNTGRNPWLWFFLGLLFSVIAILVLLSKNADDKKGKT